MDRDRPMIAFNRVIFFSGWAMLPGTDRLIIVDETESWHSHRHEWSGWAVEGDDSGFLIDGNQRSW
jgi:hypothetical protein